MPWAFRYVRHPSTFTGVCPFRMSYTMSGHERHITPRSSCAAVEREDGRVQSCVLRDDSRASAGWDVMVLQDDEPLFSQRCPDEGHARFAAASVKQDLLRTGWVDDVPAPERPVDR